MISRPRLAIIVKNKIKSSIQDKKGLYTLILKNVKKQEKEEDKKQYNISGYYRV